MTVYSNVSGEWLESSPSANVENSIPDLTQAFTKVEGVWVSVWESTKESDET